MDELKTLFGEEAITYDALMEKINADGGKTIKLANLAGGQYVSKDKYTARENELVAANNTIKGLQDAAKAFDGVDVNKLKSDFEALQNKYDTDLSSARLDNAINLSLTNAKARDVKLVKALLDMSIIKQDNDTLLGLNDQLENIKKTHDYLFDNGSSAGDDERKNSGGEHNNTGKPDFSKMSDAEYFSYISSQSK